MYIDVLFKLILLLAKIQASTCIKPTDKRKTLLRIKHGHRTNLCIFVRVLQSTETSAKPLQSIILTHFLSVAQQPKSGTGCLFLRFLDNQYLDIHSPYDSSLQAIGLSQRPLPTQRTKNTTDRQTAKPSVEFEPAIPAIQRPQTCAYRDRHLYLK